MKRHSWGDPGMRPQGSESGRDTGDSLMFTAVLRKSEEGLQIQGRHRAIQKQETRGSCYRQSCRLSRVRTMSTEAT